jgi:hypothetical protein
MSGISPLKRLTCGHYYMRREIMVAKTVAHAFRWRTAVHAHRLSLAFCLMLVVALLGGTPGRSAAAPSTSQSAADPQKDEVALALSACPAAVAQSAAVYVLGPAGYVKLRESQNGFTALVQHTAPTAVEPRCMDAEGTRTWLPRILKVAELRAQGKSREEIQAAVAAALAKGTLQPPTRLGIDYMLSTHNRVPNEKGEVTPFPPHIMIYAPYLTNKDIGVDRTNLGLDGNPIGPAFVAGDGSPYALLIIPLGAHDGVHKMPDPTATDN